MKIERSDLNQQDLKCEETTLVIVKRGILYTWGSHTNFYKEKGHTSHNLLLLLPNQKHKHQPS